MAKRRRRKKSSALPLAVLVFMGLVLGCVVMLYIKKFAPTSETMPMEEYLGIKAEDELAVIINGQIGEKDETGEPLAYNYQGRALLTLDYLKKQVDDRFYFDKNENILRYTTPEKINSVMAGENRYYSAGEAVELSYAPFMVIHDKVCVDTEFIARMSAVTIDTYSNRVVIYKEGFIKNLYTVKKKTQLRRFGGPKSPILAEVDKGSQVAIIEDYDNWCYVISDNGELGCIKSSTIKAAEQMPVTASNEKFEVTHKTSDKAISLAWYQTTNEIANSYMESTLSSVSNINVVCPTWYYLDSDDGKVADLSSRDLVNACHAKGYQVWALFSNVENIFVNDEVVLGTTSIREAVIKKVVNSVVACGADGINLDFEEIPIAGGDDYIEFVRELGLACKQNNLVFSVNNYVPTAYTAHYDRAEQGIFADYLVIMAYDEHTSVSEEPGSNASLPFVRDGVVNTMDSVPAEQIILGMPLYGRAFYTAEGSLKCATISLGNMAALKEGNKVEWQEELGQNYMKYVSDGIEKELWIEDKDSLKLKFELVNEYNLAGAAFWKLGFDEPYVWELAGEYLK